MQHKHHDLIVAWAKGAKIQGLSDSHDKWFDVESTPSWNPDRQYRIKPEPKAYVVLYGMICPDQDSHGAVRITPVKAGRRKLPSDTCMFIFDGETGKLKDAQVLVNSDLASSNK